MRLAIWALSLAMPLGISAAMGQDDRSVRFLLPHCMAGPDTQTAMSGRCAGIIATLSFVSRVLPDNLKFCQPAGATSGEIVQAIASFVDSNPDSVGQDFRLVALAAMRHKWPCQE